MIKDTTQLQGFNNIKLPKIKGTVEIKLHNPTTGKTTIERGENMITNAISDIFASNYCGFMNYDSLLPLWSNMFGGVLCFNTQLNVDSPSADAAKDDYFIPDSSTHNVTAHAGQNSFTSQADDLTRGVPSDGNVSVTDGVVTLAWEWGLSAGNGTIASLALTHADVGDAGIGSASDAFKAMVPFIPCTVGTKTLWAGNDGTKGSANANYNIPCFVYDNYGYYFYPTPNTKVLNIVRFPIAYTKSGLVYQQVKNSTFAETKSVTLGIGTNFYNSTSVNRAPFFWFDNDNVKLWIFYNTSVSSTVYCEEINLSNWSSITSTNHDFTLSGASVGPYMNYVPMPITVDNGYVYFTNMNNGNNIWKVQLSNTANITALTMVGTNQLKWGSGFITNASHKVIAAKNYVINNDVVYQCNSSNTGISHQGDNGYYYVLPYMESKKGLVCLGGQFNYTGSSAFRTEISKLYLATKYNLASAVQKTASQSMIVTYTLQEVAPNE